MFPLARTDDILAGFYVKEDGRANPVDVTVSLAKGARLAGRDHLEGVPVPDVLTEHGAVTGVRTPHGDIEAEYVVNCAGMWARQLGAHRGVNIPLQAAEHYYLLTEEIPGISRRLAGAGGPRELRLLPRRGRRPDARPLRAVCAPWQVDGVPEDFSFGRFSRTGTGWVRTWRRRWPGSRSRLDAGVKKFFCGPESFTPDLRRSSAKRRK